MTHFQVGDQVIIRYGGHQGQKGKIIKSRQTDVYEVRVEDGSVLFFSSKGLDKEASGDARRRVPKSNLLAQEQTTPLGRRLR